MLMLCKVAVGFSDVRCPVCGQGFVVHGMQRKPKERDSQRHQLGHQLRAQHMLSDNPDIHPPALSLSETAVSAALPVAQPAFAPALAAYR